MGKRGPKPIPTATLKLRGSTHLSRRAGELSPETGVPTCPEWLSDVGQAKWHELLDKDLATPGLVTISDGDNIAMYCEAWCDMLDALDEIKREGATCHHEKGGTYQHPAVGRKNKAVERMLKIGANFGMNPAARTSIKLSPVPEPENAKKKFFA